jgi:hypothetical protein
MSDTVFKMPKLGIRNKYYFEYPMRLPSAPATRNIQKYCDAWKSLCEPFCKATGAIIIGFDPDVLISFNGRSLTIPVKFVEKINELVKGAK